MGSPETLEAQQLYNDFAGLIINSIESPSVNESETIVDIDDQFTHYFDMYHSDGRCARLKVSNFKAYDDIFQKAFVTIEQFYTLIRKPYCGDKLLASLFPDDDFVKSKLIAANKLKETKVSFGVAVLNQNFSYFTKKFISSRKIANCL